MKPENDNILPPMDFSVHLSGEHFTTVKDAQRNTVAATLGLGAALSAAQLGVTVDVVTNSEELVKQIRDKYPEVIYPSLSVMIGSISGPPTET